MVPALSRKVLDNMIYHGGTIQGAGHQEELKLFYLLDFSFTMRKAARRTSEKAEWSSSFMII